MSTGQPLSSRNNRSLPRGFAGTFRRARTARRRRRDHQPVAFWTNSAWGMGRPPSIAHEPGYGNGEAPMSTTPAARRRAVKFRPRFREQEVFPSGVLDRCNYAQFPAQATPSEPAAGKSEHRVDQPFPWNVIQLLVTFDASPATSVREGDCRWPSIAGPRAVPREPRLCRNGLSTNPWRKRDSGVLLDKTVSAALYRATRGVLCPARSSRAWSVGYRLVVWSLSMSPERGLEGLYPRRRWLPWALLDHAIVAGCAAPAQQDPIFHLADQLFCRSGFTSAAGHHEVYIVGSPNRVAWRKIRGSKGSYRHRSPHPQEGA